jgi:hypothetical protein
MILVRGVQGGISGGSIRRYDVCGTLTPLIAQFVIYGNELIPFLDSLCLDRLLSFPLHLFFTSTHHPTPFHHRPPPSAYRLSPIPTSLYTLSLSDLLRVISSQWPLKVSSRCAVLG